MPYFVYILRCCDNTYYTGLAKDLGHRIWEHQQGIHTDSYTYSRRPVDLVWSKELASYPEAFQLKHQIKGWSHAKKAALIPGDLDALHLIVKEERQRREKSKKESGASTSLRSARRDKNST